MAAGTVEADLTRANAHCGDESGAIAFGSVQIAASLIAVLSAQGARMSGEFAEIGSAGK